MSKTKMGIGILLGIFLLFFVREFFWGSPAVPAIFVEKNVAIVRFQNQVFTFGDTESDEAKMSIRAATPYFLSKITKIENLENGEILENISVVRVSPNVLKIVAQGQRIVFVSDEISSAEKEQIAKTPVFLDADLWVLRTNFLPDFLPIPSVAIISLVTKPSKKVTEFAKINGVALVSATETGGAVFEFGDGKWEVKTRKSADAL